MNPSPIEDWIKSFLSFALMMGLGITGNIDNMDVADRGIRVESDTWPAMAFGNIAFSNPRQGAESYDHEYGHLIHEDILGPVYAPLAGLTSLVGNILSVANPHRYGPLYYKMGTEREADRYGGVQR